MEMKKYIEDCMNECGNISYSLSQHLTLNCVSHTSTKNTSALHPRLLMVHTGLKPSFNSNSFKKKTMQ